MKDEAAEELAQAHYRVEPDLFLIQRILSAPEMEADPREPIKLLEVNDATTPDGIRPVFFGPHPDSGLLYSSAIIEVTPGEYEHIQDGSMPLPHGWRLGPIYGALKAAE